MRVKEICWGVGSILFFLMLYTPRANLPVKVAFLAPTVAIILLALLSKRLRPPSSEVLIWVFLYAAFGAIWSAYGFVNGMAGAVDYARLYIIWSALYLLLICGIQTHSDFNRVFRVSIAATAAISIFNLLMFLKEGNYFTFLADLWLLNIEMGSNVGIHPGYVQITSHNIGSLMFLSPLLTAFFIAGNKPSSGWRQVLFWVAYLLSIVAVLLSGRRVLWMVFILAPILIVILSRIISVPLSRIVIRRAASYYLSIFGLAAITFFLVVDRDTETGWDASQLPERIGSAFFDDDVRTSQALALISGFADAPISGHGFGAGASEVIRDEERPWVYELSYHLLLHNTGILGVMFYAALMAYLVFRVISISKRVSKCSISGIALLTGSISMFIANATNPYLASFDFMFPIFLLAAFINVYGRRKQWVIGDQVGRV